MSASRLARLNGYKTKHKLRRGTLIKIPANKSTLLAMAKTGSTAYGRRSSKHKVIYYRVRPGDTLSRIAKKNRTSTSKIAKWNRLKKRSRLKVGQKLKIYKKTKGSYSKGRFVATRGKNSRTRISGIAHIIQQDQHNPAAFTPSKTKIISKRKTKIKLPKMIAQADGGTTTNKNQPGMVKTIKGDIFAKKTANKNKTTIKKKKVVKKYHTVKPGESLSTIAAKYSLRVSRLKAINSLKSDKIRTKQKLLVRGGKTTTRVTKRVATATKKSLYVVKPNDSLSSIAVKNRVTVTQLKSWNALKSDNIRTGQKLRILRGVKTRQAKNRVTSIRKNQNKVIYHYVKSGETLWSLSRKYKVKISDIIRWNKMKNDQVRPKQKIKIIASATKLRKSATL